MRRLTHERARLTVAFAGAAMLLALAFTLLSRKPLLVAIAAAAVGAALGIVRTVQVTRTVLERRPIVFIAVICAVVALAWSVLAVTHLKMGSTSATLPTGSILRSPQAAVFRELRKTDWFTQLPLPLLLTTIVAALGGMALIADAVRMQIGLASPPRSRWRALTATQVHATRAAIRAATGVGLLILACVLGLSLTDRAADYLAAIFGLGTGTHPRVDTVLRIAISVWCALLLAAPVTIGVLLRHQVDRATRARDWERERFAAHLHDSVLQTLALIQRQSADSTAVARLARRQEHALRAWMAGETELASDTLTAAVRDVVAEVEDEHGIQIEMAAIGDHKLDAGGEALVAAAREALRNAARHAPGARVNVFLDVKAHRAEMFVRDDGPGFDPHAVPKERRGLRDSVVGRMKLAGGAGIVESIQGEGTEIVLTIPFNGRVR